MKLDDLGPAPGSVKRRKRIGRGIGSGHGVRATRGNKGDKARGQSKLGFEGGQTPLHRRLPKQRGLGTGLSARGFNTGRYKTHYTIVNLSELELFEGGTTVTPELLLSNGIVKDLKAGGLKVLADGEFTKSLTVHAHKFSGSAEEKINSLGGSAVTLPPPYETAGADVEETEETGANAPA